MNFSKRNFYKLLKTLQSEIQNPSISNPFSNDFIISEISDKDIQNVLGENVFPGNVKHEGEVTGSYSQPSQQSSVLSSTNLQPGLQSSNSEDYATMYNNYYNHQIQQDWLFAFLRNFKIFARRDPVLKIKLD